MKIYKLFTLFTLISLLIISCNLISKKESETPQKKEENGVAISRTYYEKSGAIKTEITVKNKMKNGPAKKYYPTGELHTIVNYVNNVKEGETIWYYQNGQPYRVTNYVNGKMQGIRKIYYEDGKLQAEIPYKDDKLIEGTKEYDKSGKLIPQNTSIVFTTKDLLKTQNKFYLYISLSKKARNTKFFEEKTFSNGEKGLNPIRTKDGIGQLEFLVYPGDHIRQNIKIFAQYKSKLGNLYLISNSYNLTIPN